MDSLEQKKLRDEVVKFFEKTPMIHPEVRAAIILSLAIMPKENHEQQLYVRNLINKIIKGE